MQRHFLSDGTVAQFSPHLIRPHAFQRLVDVVQQYVRTAVIPSLDLRTRGKTHRSALVEVEPGVALSNVVPSMRVLDLCQSALSLARHRYALRQVRDVMSQGVIGVHLHGSVAR